MKPKLTTLLVTAITTPLLAAGASHWTHTSEADFKRGTFQNVVATNLGDLKLSRAIKTLLRQDPRLTSVYCLVEAPDGTIYAGTGPQGIILQLKDDRVTTLATLEDENIFSMLIDAEGRLLVGTGGEKGRILRIDKPAEGSAAKPQEIFSADGVQYVWRMVQLPDRTIYAATGPSGQVHQVNPDGTSALLFDSNENNVLSLATDNKDLLFAGTDPNGLVYRINRKTKETFVLYDANESEISSLALDAKGNLYAGTGQASEQEEMPQPEQPGATDKTGRPEGGADVTPLPSPRPGDPKPPQPPDPRPGEPDPIPKKPNEKSGDPKLYTLEPEAAEAIKKALDQTGNQAEAPGPPAPGPGPGPGPSPGPAPAPNPNQPGIRPGPRPPGVPGMPMPGAPEGNAIYRISPEGFVTEVFRQPAMVLAMIEREGTLLVGTGSEGLIYEVNPAAEETIVLAKVDPKQVMSMLLARDGRIVLGMANVGGIATMSSGFAPDGSYTSPVLDASQISRLGKLRLQGSLPSGSTLTVATRSGNLQEPGETGWSKWSEEMPATEFLQIPSPAARFFQYRLTFTSKDAKATAVVDEVSVAYQIPNLPPQIKTIRVIGTGGEADGGAPMAMPNMPAFNPTGGPALPGAPTPPGGRMRAISWEAADPNNDAVEYTLAFRAGARGPWITLQDKLKEPQFQWDTRGVPDGRYQIRVTATDERANPKGEGRTASRVSDPVTVDNTPPVIGDLKATVAGKTARLDARVIDRASTVTNLEYALNSKADWQAVRASDNIFDSPDETVSVSIEGLAAGAYQIMLRATDAHSNQAFETVQVTIE